MSDGIVSVLMQVVVYESMYYLKGHNEPVFGLSCLQRFPVKVIKH